MNPLAMRWCPACGADAIRDEDGCCATCGATLISDEVLRAVVEAAEAEEREACAAAIETRRHYWSSQADVAGERRDWDGTNRYEAMAEAAMEMTRVLRAHKAAKGESGDHR